MANDPRARKALSVQCPGCDASYKVPRQAVGQTLVCPNCKGAIQIVGVISANAQSPGVDREPATPSSDTEAHSLNRGATNPSATESLRLSSKSGMALWAVVTSLAAVAAIAELLNSIAVENPFDAANRFVRPEFGCIVIATLMMAVGLIGKAIVDGLQAKWLSLIGYLLWPMATASLLLLFIVPGSSSYWFPYAPNSVADAIASTTVGRAGVVLVKYALLVPTMMMIGHALFGENSPVNNVARLSLGWFANLLWLPFQALIFLWSAPRVWWMKWRYPARTSRLEFRIEKQSLEVGKSAEALVPKHIDNLSDAIRQSFVTSAEYATEIHTWRAERGQDEDHGIKQALEAAVDVIGEHTAPDKTQELQSLQVNYENAVRALALTVLSTPSYLLREMPLHDAIGKVRGAKEVAHLAESAEQALSNCESSLPLGVRSAYCAMSTVSDELQNCRVSLGLTEKKGLQEALTAATKVLRRDALTPQQQAELNAAVSIRDLMLRELGLAFASSSVELLRETGLEKQAGKLRESRAVEELGRVAESLLQDASVDVPQAVADAADRAAQATEQQDTVRGNLGLNQQGGIKNFLGTAAATLRRLKLTREQKTQLESLGVKRRQSVKDLGAAMLGGSEAFFEQLGLTPRFQELRDGKETFLLGEAAVAALDSRRDKLSEWLLTRYEAVVQADESLASLRQEFGLDQSRISQALGAATAQLRGRLTSEQKQELDAINTRYEEAKRNVAIALLCGTGDWSPPEPLSAEIDNVRNGKLISQFGKSAEKTLPKFREQLLAAASPGGRAG